MTIPRKTIVVTGATSTVLNRIIDRLDPAGNRIIGVTRTLRPGLRDDIEWVACDLSVAPVDYAFVKGADLIIHAAAVSNTHRESAYEAVNLQSTIHLVDQAKRHGVPDFIYISSIFAGSGNGPYGLSKYKAEQYIREHLGRYLIVRSAQLYGHSATAPIDRLIRRIQDGRWIVCPMGDIQTLYPLHCDRFADWFQGAVQETQSRQRILYCRGPQSFNYHQLVTSMAGAICKKVLIIPVRKPLMLLMAQLIRLTHIQAGVYPDQIYRLYHARFDFEDYPQFVSDYRLSDYLRERE